VGVQNYEVGATAALMMMMMMMMSRVMIMSMG
jgi:hypothetical protein